VAIHDSIGTTTITVAPEPKGSIDSEVMTAGSIVQLRIVASNRLHAVPHTPPSSPLYVIDTLHNLVIAVSVVNDQ
jgi:hypothetical protein